jgi:hypothetical protein
MREKSYYFANWQRLVCATLRSSLFALIVTRNRFKPFVAFFS